MELSIFMKELEKALTERGIPADVSVKHVKALTSTFTDEDISEIERFTSNEEIADLADSISPALKRKLKRPPTAKESSVERAETKNLPTGIDSAAVTEPKKEEPLRPNNDSVIRDGLDGGFREKNVDDARNSRNFRLGSAAAFPITIILSVLVGALFVSVFAALGVLIVGVFAVMIAVITSGAAIALIGIIYGITQLFKYAPVGLYEIGIGVVIIGVVLLISVLLYNVAIRFIPWVIKKVGMLLTFVFRKIKELFRYIRMKFSGIREA